MSGGSIVTEGKFGALRMRLVRTDLPPWSPTGYEKTDPGGGVQKCLIQAEKCTHDAMGADAWVAASEGEACQWLMSVVVESAGRVAQEEPRLVDCQCGGKPCPTGGPVTLSYRTSSKTYFEFVGCPCGEPHGWMRGEGGDWIVYFASAAALLDFLGAADSEYGVHLDCEILSRRPGPPPAEGGAQ